MTKKNFSVEKVKENEKKGRPFIFLSNDEVRSRLEKIRSYLSTGSDTCDRDFFEQKILDLEDEIKIRNI